MNLEQAVNMIESHEFAVRAGLASDLRTFFDAVRQEKSVQYLLSQGTQEQDVVRQLLDRINDLAHRSIDIRYSNPWDAALTAYLWIIHLLDDEWVSLAAKSILQSANTWWAARYAESILSKTASSPRGQSESTGQDQTDPSDQFMAFLAERSKEPGEISLDELERKLARAEAEGRAGRTSKRSIEVEPLFADFLDNPDSYRAAQDYWRNLWLKTAPGARVYDQWQEPWMTEIPSLQDGNPIFSAWSPQLRKGIRVIQDPPTSEKPEIQVRLDTFGGPITDPGSIRELVIACALSTETAAIALSLMDAWMAGGITISFPEEQSFVYPVLEAKQTAEAA
jgi:hypothetical protein